MDTNLPKTNLKEDPHIDQKEDLEVNSSGYPSVFSGMFFCGKCKKKRESTTCVDCGARVRKWCNLCFEEKLKTGYASLDHFHQKKKVLTQDDFPLKFKGTYYCGICQNSSSRSKCTKCSMETWRWCEKCALHISQTRRLGPQTSRSPLGNLLTAYRPFSSFYEEDDHPCATEFINRPQSRSNTPNLFVGDVYCCVCEETKTKPSLGTQCVDCSCELWKWCEQCGGGEISGYSPLKGFEDHKCPPKEKKAEKVEFPSPDKSKNSSVNTKILVKSLTMKVKAQKKIVEPPNSVPVNVNVPVLARRSTLFKPIKISHTPITLNMSGGSKTNRVPRIVPKKIIQPVKKNVLIVPSRGKAKKEPQFNSIIENPRRKRRKTKKTPNRNINTGKVNTIISHINDGSIDMNVKRRKPRKRRKRAQRQQDFPVNFSGQFFCANCNERKSMKEIGDNFKCRKCDSNIWQWCENCKKSRYTGYRSMAGFSTHLCGHIIKNDSLSGSEMIEDHDDGKKRRKNKVQRRRKKVKNNEDEEYSGENGEAIAPVVDVGLLGRFGRRVTRSSKKVTDQIFGGLESIPKIQNVTKKNKRKKKRVKKKQSNEDEDEYKETNENDIDEDEDDEDYEESPDIPKKKDINEDEEKNNVNNVVTSENEPERESGEGESGEEEEGENLTPRKRKRRPVTRRNVNDQDSIRAAQALFNLHNATIEEEFEIITPSKRIMLLKTKDD